eukprot:270023-Rhodomonas_salina.2
MGRKGRTEFDMSLGLQEGELPNPKCPLTNPSIRNRDGAVIWTTNRIIWVMELHSGVHAMRPLHLSFCQSFTCDF